MKRADIDPTATYRNDDPGLGEPGEYTGLEILDTLDVFEAETGERLDADEEYDIVEVEA